MYRHCLCRKTSRPAYPAEISPNHPGEPRQDVCPGAIVAAYRRIWGGMVVVKKVVVTMVDDLDKKSPADETVEFSRRRSCLRNRSHRRPRRGTARCTEKVDYPCEKVEFRKIGQRIGGQVSPSCRPRSECRHPRMGQGCRFRDFGPRSYFHRGAPSLRKGRLKWIANGFGRILPKRIDNAF